MADYYVYDQKSSSPSYAVPGTKNLFGGNLDVVSKLDDISFEPFADGSLRNSIAYIIPWVRGNSGSGTQLSSAPAAAPRAATLEALVSELTDIAFTAEGTFDYIPDLESSYTGQQYIPLWDSEDSIWRQTDTAEFFTNNIVDYNVANDFKTDLGSNYYSRYETDESGQTRVERSEAESRQTNLSADIPIGFRQGLLTGASFLADTFIENATINNIADQGIRLASDLFNAPSGPVYLGNANGIINQVLDYANLFGANIPTGFTTSIHPDLQSNKSKWNEANLSGASVTPDGMWQFLFNPEGITLAASPQFSASETWGVSDEPNAGQPLHWTNHKNAELRFNKVLLNGYIFKKSVESLEQGIIELFMKTPTNDATHGPQVLEFVWGKKCFGPCVIKDIQVTEKMWDNGLLVNAEVSFTLVKVPEWTINDGQVSTYDPSALPPVEDPTEKETRTAKETPEDSDKPQPRPQSQLPSLFEEVEYAYTQKECDTGRYTAKNFITLSQDPRLSPNLWDRAFGSSDAAANVAVNKYVTIYNSYASVLSTLPGLDPICKQKCEYRGQAAQANNTLIGCAKSCSEQAARLLNTRYNTGNNKCPNPTLLPG